jgi:hypothetical protein
VTPVSTHVAKVWRVDNSPFWRWACTCGKAGASTAERGARDAAAVHEHRIRR